MGKPYAIRISSLNGGVGKSILCVNLASALSLMKYKVLLIDGDTISPSISFYLDLKEIKEEVRKVDLSRMDIEVMRKINIRNTLSIDKRTGLYVLPALVTTVPVILEDSSRFVMEKAKELKDYDFIISDTHAGYYRESLMRLYDDIVIMSLPNMHSITYAIQLNEICKKMKVKTDLVLNKLGIWKNELDVEEVEEAFGERILGGLPYDDAVLKSEDEQEPAVILNKNSRFSKKIYELAKVFAGRI